MCLCLPVIISLTFSQSGHLSFCSFLSPPYSSFTPFNSSECSNSNWLHWLFKGSRSVWALWCAQQELVETLLAWLPLKSSKRVQETLLPDQRRKDTRRLGWSAMGTLLLELMDKDVWSMKNFRYDSFHCWTLLHFTALSWTKNITNLQLSAKGKCANVRNDSGTIEVNTLINRLRIILYHYLRKKKKKWRIWKSNRMSSALFQSLRSSWILTITSWHCSWHLP